MTNGSQRGPASRLAGTDGGEGGAYTARAPCAPPGPFHQTHVPPCLQRAPPWAQTNQTKSHTPTTYVRRHPVKCGMPLLPPCVTFRLVVVPLWGPGQSPVLPFVCCVGLLLSVGLCGWCSCWCRFRVCGAPPPCWLLPQIPRYLTRHAVRQGTRGILRSARATYCSLGLLQAPVYLRRLEERIPPTARGRTIVNGSHHMDGGNGIGPLRPGIPHAAASVFFVVARHWACVIITRNKVNGSKMGRGRSVKAK